jgi:Tol biopolymer transport system component
MSDAFTRLSAALADRYRIERELGAGGMATVYLAEDLKHDRKVAIKVLKPELAAVLGAERFVQEIKTTAALSHPHILPLFDSGEAGGFLYYVMPWIKGETIREKLNRETQLGIDEAVKITTEVADALDYAHQNGVIHRDIKPENILLHNGRPMVMDFGIALAVSAAAGGRMTETGLSLGTPHYMSPEQATADKAITARSDVYSLASVCYEMLAGEPPHMGNSAQAIIMKIVTDTARPVTELRKSVPTHVAAALAKALEKLPADRFDTANAFAAALGSPTFTIAATAAASGAAAHASARLRGLAAGLAATTLLATAFAAWGWLRPDPPKPVARYPLAIKVDGEWRASEMVQLSLAPDGSWLVYTGRGSRYGNSQLWVKTRERLEAEPLDGTAGAYAPSVSPDGKWVAFYVNAQLRKVPAGGGSAATIADSANYGQGIWLDDGSMVYSDIPWRLRRTSVGGGAPAVLFRPAPGRYATALSALPNSRGVLFVNCTSRCNDSEIWVLDLRSGDAKRLLQDAGWAAYADGRLIFARTDGVVFGVAFDLSTLGMTGAPIPLFEGVAYMTVAQMAIARSGTLAYLAGRTSAYLFEAVWVSRDGRAEPVDSAMSFRLGGTSGWALSPDDKRMALSSRTEQSNEDIWIKELDRGPMSRLTFGDYSDIRPVWTPDGRAVAFSSDRAGNFDLYQRRADGTGTDSLIVDLEQPVFEAVWSHDGEWLVLRAGSAGSRDIFALRMGRDTVPRPLLTGPYDEDSPALSPDGRWLAYVSEETGRREVFVRPFPDVDSGKWQVSTTGGASPVWAHSGRELFFMNGSRELVSQGIASGAAFQRGELRVLFSLAGYREVPFGRSFGVSMDDRRFLMVRPKAGIGTERDLVPVVVENWMDEVDRIMRSGSR